jgi:hypothetical protein
MNRILSFAAAAAVGFFVSTGAQAQQITIDLGALTGMTGDQVGSFTNIAVNNAEIDGSVDAAVSSTAFLEATAETSTGAIATSQSAVENALGDVETTVIGAVNEGSITLGIASTVDDAVAGGASASSDYIGPLQDTLAANLAFNQFALDASVSIAATNAALEAQGVATTAIGAVNTGSIVTGVAGTLADINVTVD